MSQNFYFLGRLHNVDPEAGYVLQIHNNMPATSKLVGPGVYVDLLANYRIYESELSQRSLYVLILFIR